MAIAIYLTKVRYMQSQDIQRVRSFNRSVVHRIGALDDDFLGRGRPLAESRLLYEIGEEGQEIRKLRRRLSLDSGYFSRLVRALERQRLVVSKRSGTDSRVKEVHPTAKGLAEIRELNSRSDELAASLLDALGSSQRETLLGAMDTVKRFLQLTAVRIYSVQVTDPAAEACIQAYFKELDERFEHGFDAKQSNPADPEELTPPNGVFIIAQLDGKTIGCGALRAMSRRVGELKRMWVEKTARGIGVGRRMLEHLERCAVDLGIDTLRLETNRSLHEAQHLYRAYGFEEVEPFNDEPYAHHWFEKRGLRRRPSQKST